MIRQALTLLVSAATASTSMAGLTRALDYRIPPPPRILHGPEAPEPFVETFPVRDPLCARGAAPDIGALPLIADPATMVPSRSPDKIPAFTLCALIGTDGRISALRPMAGGGRSRHWPRLARTLRQMTFRPAFSQERPVAAWHRLEIAAGPLRTIPFAAGRLTVTLERLPFDVTAEPIEMLPYQRPFPVD